MSAFEDVDREALRDYYDDPPWDDEREDARAEARREDAFDRFDEVAVTCAECGNRYDPEWVPATRTDPGYPRRDHCPSCGSDAVEED